MLFLDGGADDDGRGPNVAAQSAYATPAGAVTVDATTVRASTAPGHVAARGILPAKLLVSGGPAATGTVSGALLGPDRTDAGQLPTTGWDKAAVRAKLAPTTLNANGTTNLTTADPTVAGCNAIDLTTVLTMGYLGSVTVALAAAPRAASLSSWPRPSKLRPTRPGSTRTHPSRRRSAFTAPRPSPAR